jgi:hypothetical protein
MARGPGTFEDRTRFAAIQGKVRILREERTKRADGTEEPSHARLKEAAETLVYEDMEWLITKIERNWD